ncbi:uncharacterized protein TNCV_683431 [Trichonephila clavipes]|nr:uncharacterized protein TNCV_683431 [Trichonephila clavipes]
MWSPLKRSPIGVGCEWSLRRESEHAQERERERAVSQLTPLDEFLEHRRSANSDEYCETLGSIHRPIKNKRLGQLTEGGILFHENVHPRVSRVTHAELAFKWEQFGHPLYSLDMSPRNFHVFSPLKGKHFNSDDELKDAEKDWISSWSEKFWK